MREIKKVKSKSYLSFVGKIAKRLKKAIRKLLYQGSSYPKEYRPYQPPGLTDGTEEQDIRSKGRRKHKKRKTIFQKINFFKHFAWNFNIKRKTKRKPRPKKRRPDSKISGAARIGFINKLSDNLKTYRHRRKKSRQKKRYKRRKRRELQRIKRIQFIRRYFPDYKQESEVKFDFSIDDSTEEKEKSRHGSYFAYSVNSIASFIVAYLVVYMLYQFAVLIVASNWKLDSILFYYDLAFNDFSPLWNRKNIIIVTFAGPFISLIIGFLFIRYFSDRRKISKQAKLFMLWLGLHGLNFFLGAFASGVSFDEGFGYVPAWLFINVFWKILLSMISLFILGAAGYYAAPKFLDTSYSISRVRPNNKTKFLIFQVLIPWIIGGLIIFLVKIPSNMPYDVGILITMLFAVIPALLNTQAKPTRRFKIEKKPTSYNYWILGITVATLLLYRLGLNNGLHFELYYEFIFSLNITPL